jgi:catechol 2,3-dioxygenase-like lactoylglutathione lyase family enzyme
MSLLASLVLFSSRVQRTVAFYRAVGLDLVGEDHGDGEHYAADIAGIHVAVLDAETSTAHPAAWREAGTTFPGFWVDSLDVVLTDLSRAGAPLLVAHEPKSWGCRAVVKDPDGRTVELNQRDHCPVPG